MSLGTRVQLLCLMIVTMLRSRVPVKYPTIHHTGYRAYEGRGTPRASREAAHCGVHAARPSLLPVHQRLYHCLQGEKPAPSPAY